MAVWQRACKYGRELSNKLENNTGYTIGEDLCKMDKNYTICILAIEGSTGSIAHVDNIVELILPDIR